MTRTFCDICGEEFKASNTAIEGECVFGGKVLAYRLAVFPKKAEESICRKCVLEAVRYIADNK